MNTKLSLEQIETNWSYLKGLLLSTKREGIDKLIEYIESTDFKLSPASTQYHHSFIGGLVVHTIEVYKNAVELNKAMKFKIRDDQLIIAAVLHDLCKANTYDTYKKNVKDDNGTWKQVDAFLSNDKWPIGHASKSVIIAQMFITLDDLEISLMIAHMGPYTDPNLYTQLTTKYPEGILLHTADMLSSKGVKIYE